MAVKATLLTFFSSALLASGSGPDGFLAQGTSTGESSNSGNAGVVTAELEQAVRPQDTVAGSSPKAEPAASAEEDSLPEVGEVSAEEDNQEMPDSLVAFLEKVWEVPAEEDHQEMPDSLVAFLETLELSSMEAADSDANETVDASAVSAANCDTKLLRQLQKKVGHHTWHDCVDPNPEVCHTIDAAIKAYLRKGGKRAAKKSICRHQGDFKDAFEHNYEKCKILAKKAAKQGLHMPSSPEDLKHMCR